VHHWFGTALLHLGDFERSLAELNLAQQLDPTSRAILADKGLVLFYAGRTSEAVDLLKQLAQSEPDFLSPNSYLAAIYFAEGKYEDYLTSARRAAELLKDDHKLAVLAASADALSRGGPPAMLAAMLAEQKRLEAAGSPDLWNLARTYALLGNSTEAEGYLRVALDKRDQNIVGIRIEPAFRSLHDDPRFKRLVADVGLPPL
jgi:serine/threonine-protein kinase